MMKELAVEPKGADSTAAVRGLSPMKGLLVVAGIALVVALYLGLAMVLGLKEFWAGFLFLFFWAGIEQMRFERINAAVMGASMGLLTALALNQLPILLGITAGLGLALGLVVILVYCQVMGWISLLVNNATMLFLTVATIPHLQTHGSFDEMFAALYVGVAFFGGLLWCISLLIKKRS